MCGTTGLEGVGDTQDLKQWPEEHAAVTEESPPVPQSLHPITKKHLSVLYVIVYIHDIYVLQYMHTQKSAKMYST